jgi:hypothetical protein
MDLTTTECRGRLEVDQPKVGPKGESRPGKVEKDCRKAAPKEEQDWEICESKAWERPNQIARILTDSQRA